MEPQRTYPQAQYTQYWSEEQLKSIEIRGNSKGNKATERRGVIEMLKNKEQKTEQKNELKL